MRHFSVLAVFLAVLFVSMTISQDFVKEVPNLPNFYAIGTDPTTAILTPQQPVERTDPKVTELVAKIKEARSMNNSLLKEQYEAELNRISGSSVTTGQNPAHETPILIKESGQSPPFFDNMINTVQIRNVPNWCVATATVPVGAPGAGNIIAASGNFNAAGTDTMRIYRSTNGGVSWSSIISFTYGGTDNINFVANDLDIEILYDGTAAYMYLICRVVNATSGTHFLQGFRLQLTSLSAAFFSMSFPGATANNNYYNARICSDSPRWTSAAYVYLMCSFDTADGSQRRCRQKFALITAPYAAAISVTHRNPGPAGWNWHTAVPNGSYYWGDICYFDANGTDRVLTVANFPTTVAFPSMYLAWSNNYGVAIAGSLTITEAAANVTFGARIATNGNQLNQNVMINYTRLFSGTDWDPYFRRTTNGGATTGDWTGGFIDASGSRSRYVDVIGVTSGAGHFKSAYIQDSTGAPGGRNFLYRTYSGGAWSGSYRMNHLTPDTSFGKIRAGYRNGGGDDCFAVWANGNGDAVWCTYACGTTVGISNNGGTTPFEYALSQNYPNPFNPVTNIKFSIPRSSFVKLVVYDVMGREVSTVINQDMNSGNYNVDFDAAHLSSGVYFYKLVADGFTETKKMLLVK